MKPLIWLALFSIAGQARADTLVGDVPIWTGGTLMHDGGFVFRVGSTPLLVTKLGVWDMNHDGLANPNVIGLWDGNGTLLAFAGVPQGTLAPIVGGFRYAWLGGPPVILSPNTVYILATYCGDGLENRTSGNYSYPLTFSGDVSVLGSRRGFPGTVTSPGDAICGPNMQYTKILPPDPDSDGDGLTDGQETNIYHTDPLVADTDGDGYNDGTEISNGSNPNDPNSTPEGNPLMLVAVEYRFTSQTGISYRIEVSVDLVNWSTVETLTGTGNVISRLYSIQGQQKRFFRAQRN